MINTVFIVLIDRYIGGSETRFFSAQKKIISQSKIKGIRVKYIINQELLLMAKERFDIDEGECVVVRSYYGKINESSSGAKRLLSAFRLLFNFIIIGWRVSQINKNSLSHFIGYTGMIISIPSIILGRKLGYSIIGYEARVFNQKIHTPKIYNKYFIMLCLNYSYFLDALGVEVRENLLKAKALKKLSNKIYLNKSFVEVDKYTPSSKENIISFVGRFEEYKQPLLFIKIALEFNKINKRYKFIMIGSGGQIKKMRSLSLKHSMGKYLKIASDNEISPQLLLAKSSFFLSIQRYENYPSRSLLEAMSCENAIIATNVGHTHLLVNCKNGILVDNNPKKIARLINQSIEDGRYKNMMKLSRVKIIESGWVKDKYIDRILDIYLNKLKKI
jgi:glycosyltransferase involved in cell wall biosynthesis